MVTYMEREKALQKRKKLEKRIIKRIVRRKYKDHEYLEEAEKLIKMLSSAIFDPPPTCAACGYPITTRPWVRKDGKDYHPWCIE